MKDRHRQLVSLGTDGYPIEPVAVQGFKKRVYIFYHPCEKFINMFEHVRLMIADGNVKIANYHFRVITF